jgi:putative ABC transport system permease protein
LKASVLFAIIGESLRFAFQNIRANLLRTLLSLLGITIGVFCIISIFTLVDSFEITIRDSVSRFGDNVILLQKIPWIFDTNRSYLDYMKRPDPKFREMEQLQKRLKNYDAISFNLFLSDSKLTYEGSSQEGILVRAVSHDYDRIVDMNFLAGRYFTEEESQQGSQKIILGYDLATNLFGQPERALDKDIMVFSRKLHVIGVLVKEGKALGIGGQSDKMALVPLNFMRNLTGTEKTEFGPTIFVKGRPGQPISELEEELRGVMRSVRKLDPREDDNFALNKITIFTNLLTKLFAQINLYGWVIAGFSILVGGFGIANIMFVSVKERTSIIGIQKALGAKSYFILIQFLAESVILCILGGVIGLLLVFLISKAVNVVFPIELVLTFKNIMIGIGISSVIGVIAGYVPSQQAASMDPIEAIRTGI